MPADLPVQTTARARRIAALTAAALVAAFGAHDVARGSQALALVLTARAIWIAALIVVSRLALEKSDRRVALAATIAAGASIVAISVLVYVDGGKATGSMMFLLAAPLFIAVLLPDEITVAIFAAAASMIATVLVFAMLGRAPNEIAIAVVRAAVAGAFAIFAAALQERVRREEAGIARKLAAVEETRARNEPLAEAATKARAVAHDMSSPLATVKSNLEWLWEAAQDGRIRVVEPEVMTVIDDARAATDRLRKGLGELRQAAMQARDGMQAS